MCAQNPAYRRSIEQDQQKSGYRRHSARRPPCQKLDSLGYILAADAMETPSVNLTQLAPKAAAMCEVTPVITFKVTQGHQFWY